MAALCVASCLPGARGLASTAGARLVAARGSHRAVLSRHRRTRLCGAGDTEAAQGAAGAAPGAVAPPGAGLAPDAPLSLWEPAEEDARVIQERHLDHKMNILAVGMRCKHGCPQAFAHDSLSRQPMVYRSLNGELRSKPRALPLEAGLFRLSCPLLVAAIDAWEAEGAVVELNGRVAADATGALPDALRDAHDKHAAARMALFRARLDARLAALPADDFAHSAEGQAALRHIVGSGIAGQTREKQDVKCLHAQVADFLCRNGDNAIGALVLEELRARGVATRGDAACHNQCDLGVPIGEAKHGWWYTPRKNKLKLRTTARRRHQEKREAAAAAAATASEWGPATTASATVAD